MSKFDFFKWFYLFLERREGREKEGKKHQCERETLIGYLSHPQPTYVPWPGIEPATFRFAGWCPTSWASQVRVSVFDFNQIVMMITKDNDVYQELGCLLGTLPEWRTVKLFFVSGTDLFWISQSYGCHVVTKIQFSKVQQLLRAGKWPAATDHSKPSWPSGSTYGFVTTVLDLRNKTILFSFLHNATWFIFGHWTW